VTVTTYRSRARRRTRRLLVLVPCAGLALLLSGPAASAVRGPGPVPCRATACGVGGGAAAQGPAPTDPATRPPTGAPRQTRTPAPTGTPAPTDTPAPTGAAASTGTPAPTGAADPTRASGPAVTPVRHVGPGEVALTIDDGPDPRWTPQVLDLLRANGVTATFCLVGTQVRAHPDLVRRIAAEGHALCDHTESHDIHLPARPAATVDAEVRSGRDDIAVAAGVRPVWFRAPGGNWSPEILAAAARLGMTPLDWSVDPRDWDRPGAAAIAATVGAAPGGSVVLVHDGGGDRSQTVAALATALPRLRARGLRFVTP
jgi:peptidoglycan-N-acetylglucosamine deacetylase